MKIKVETVKLSGWPIVKLTRNEFAEVMVQDCLDARKSNTALLPKLAMSMNGQALSLCETDSLFKKAMRSSDYIQADGQSFVFASRLLTSNALPERVSTTDFFHDAAEIAMRNDLNFYILGADQEQNEKAVREIKKMYPNLNIVGHRDGYFQEEDIKSICSDIVKKETDVLWLGLGKPKEQIFCIEHLEKLRGVGWVKTCGGLFDFLSGKNDRAPKWMQNAGLEWLYRLVKDPKRLFYRYLTTNVHTVWLLINKRER